MGDVKFSRTLESGRGKVLGSEEGKKTFQSLDRKGRRVYKKKFRGEWEGEFFVRRRELN